MKNFARTTSGSLSESTRSEKNKEKQWKSFRFFFKFISYERQHLREYR